MNEDTVLQDTQTPDEELELDLEIGETASTSEDDVEKIKETNKKLFERAKKAEAELKAMRSNPVETKKETPISKDAPQYLTYEQGVLLAQGYKPEDLSQLEVIAKGKGVNLLEASKDPLFEAYRMRKEEDEKEQKKQLSASKGAGLKKPETYPQTREDHKKWWNEKMGK